MSDQSTENKDIENGQPVDEGGEVGEAGGAKKKVDPGFKRNLLIIGGVFGVAILLLVGMFVMRSSKADKSSTSSVNVGIPQSTHSNPDGDQQMSPAMKEAVREKLAMEQRAAAASGQPVYMPADVLEVAQPIKKAEAQQNNYQNYQRSESMPHQPSAEDLERVARRRAGMERQVGAMLNMADAGRQVPVRISFSTASNAFAAPAGAVATGASAAVTAAGTAAQSLTFQSNVLAQELEIAAAENASPIDSYKTNYASARIVSGKLAGAFLVGTIRTQEDGLQINYTQMRIGKQTYSIDAIALDEKTSTNAMDGNVDRRYLQRWVIPVAAAALGGFAQASAKTDVTTVATPSGTNVASNSPTLDQARAAGVAAGMGIFQKQVDKEANMPFQIKLDVNTPMGIMFRKSVVEKN